MHTKIIATIGPKSESYETLKAMTEAGMNIARMNFSHCTYEEYRNRKATIDRINKELGTDVKIMQDLQGPRIRVGKLPQEGVTLTEGEVYTFSHGQAYDAQARIIPIDDPYLHADIKAGEPFYLVNGAIQLAITEVTNGNIIGTVTRGGILFSNKGINVPMTNLSRGGLTDKDIEDVRFALGEGVDYVALSFVQSAADIEKLRGIIGTDHKAQIIPKIERRIALDNIDEIIKASDGLMVARGDLGIEMAMEDLPIVQKNLVRHAHWHSKPAIIATQMMMSMIDHQSPTRAEVSDVANAVFEGADAVMVSDESAAGSYPVDVIATMRKIVSRIEQHIGKENYFDTNILA